MTDFADRLAEAVGDANALLRLALELMQHNAKLEAEAAVLAERRQRDAERKRRPRNSMDVRGTDGNSRETRGNPAPPAPPSPSLSFPTPLINPSSPPSPPTSTSAATGSDDESDDERQFYADVASVPFAGVARRFLAGKSATARIAWIGRFRGAMSRPPHPTIVELADALEDLMTRPPADWTPTVFRTFVGRIRRDATRETVRDADLASQVAQRRLSSASGGRAGATDHVAEAAWQATLALLPKWQRRELRSDTFDAMAPPMRAAISEIGGLQVLAQTSDERRVWIKRDFLAAYQRAVQTQSTQAAAPPEAQSA